MRGKISIAGVELREILTEENAREILREIFHNVHPFEIFSLIEGLEAEDIAKVIMKLGFPIGAEVFEYFEDEDREEIFKSLTRDQMVKLIEEMSADDRVDLLKSLPQKLVDSLMPFIAQAERNDIKRLLDYTESTAGAIMTTEYATLNMNMTVSEGLIHLKHIAPERETIFSVYIVDEERVLVGGVNLDKLILSKETQLIKEIMNREIISVKIDDDQENVSKVMADYDLLVVPVIDNENKMVGIITIDDIVDVVNEEATEDFLRHGSVQGDVDYITSNPFNLAKQRIIWLLLLVLVGFISGFIMQLKQEILESVIALAFFLPLLSGSAGNAGTQSSTVIIRGLATGELEMKDIWKIILKEMVIGLIIGIALGLASGLRAVITDSHHDMRLAFTVGISMVFVVTLSTLLGAIFPVIFKKMKLDPALMSAPFIASIIDIFSIFIYLSLAEIMF
ncbi:MAG: magnesium transporter [bacterium]|nr:magnesium transporter [bacterium]